MKRCGHDSRTVRGLRQCLRKLLLAEIHHSLSRGTETVHIAVGVRLGVGRGVFVHFLFHILLETEERESPVFPVFFRDIVRLDGDHDSCIGPSGIAGRIGHSVQDSRPVLCGRRHQDASRAHAEGEYSPVVHLLDERVLCSRHLRFPLSAVTDSVDERLGMLHAYSKCESLGLESPALPVEQFVNILGGVTRGKDHRAGLEGHRSAVGPVCRSYRNHPVLSPFNVGETGLEMIFASVGNDAFPYVRYESWQLVGPDVRVGVNENGRIRPEIDELIKDLAVVATL